MKNNKKGIVIISVIFILIIAAAVLAYLFLMTDVFKSNRELFAKYFTQNLQALEEVTDLPIEEVYRNIESQNTYESNIKINMIHSEGGEVSNPLNNLSMRLDIQKDNVEQYFYTDGQILYEDEEYLEAEIIKDQGNYGIRFTDAVKQFVTVEKDENIETVANDIGIDMSELEMILNIIDGSGLETQGEQLSSLKHKYTNIITTAISNGTFEKQKNALITYNDITTKTNAYSVSLNSEQVESLLIEILNNVKNETEILEQIKTLFNKDGISEQFEEIIRKINEELEIPTIKITVYENNQKNIRTEIEIGIDKIIIENTKQEGETKSKIKYLDVNDEQTIQYDCEISNSNTEAQGDFQISLNVIEGETGYTITLSNEIEKVDNTIKINTKIVHTEEITTKTIELENQINIGNDFEKIEKLAVGNYIPLNEMKEEKRKELINLLKVIVPQKSKERSDLLSSKFVKEETPNAETENAQTEDTEIVAEMSQVEINKFNAKFEFYTGDEVSAENVKMLLDVVKDNMAGHSITSATFGEDNEKSNIMIFIEKDSKKEESMTEILAKIENNKKYKVTISYKEQNGLIETITIIEV